MRLKFEFFDGRAQNYIPIINEDTGQQVGSISSHGNGRYNLPRSIDISLFGGKYAISVDSYAKCWGFVKGVEAVLSHVDRLTSTYQISQVTAA